MQLLRISLDRTQAQRTVHDNRVVAFGQEQTILLQTTYFHGDSESLLSEQVHCH